MQSRPTSVLPSLPCFSLARPQQELCASIACSHLAGLHIFLAVSLDADRAGLVLAVAPSSVSERSPPSQPRESLLPV